MARASQVLVILVVALAIAKPFSLPPAKFLKDFALKYQRSSIVMSIPKEISRNQVVKRYITMYKACPFEFGLIKFALDPVGEFFFKKCQKNYMCLSDLMVVNFFEMHLIQHFFFGNDFFFHFKKTVQSEHHFYHIKINWKQSKNTLISPFLGLRPLNYSYLAISNWL